MITINGKGAKALYRGLLAFLESLIDYTRVDVIDEAKRPNIKIAFWKMKGWAKVMSRSQWPH